MKRPLADKRPVGPFVKSSRISTEDSPTVGVLYIEAEDNERFDRAAIEGEANFLIDQLSHEFEQSVVGLSPWVEDQVRRFIEWERRGVYVTVQQRHAVFGKLSPTFTGFIEDGRELLEKRQSIGSLREGAFVAANPEDWPTR